MREIPTLQTFCLRAVGSHACSAEETFAPADPYHKLSTASRLLRSFHRRPITTTTETETTETTTTTTNDTKYASIDEIPMTRTPCIGPGSARRLHANQVDMHQPIVGFRNGVIILYQQYGNPATDALQAYADALVEMGRMDDTRLGRHFFEEYRHNIILGNNTTTATTTTSSSSSSQQQQKTAVTPPPPSKKKKRQRRTTTTGSRAHTPIPTAVGSLSLHNGTFSTDTVEALLESHLCPHLRILDLTAVHGLTDDLVHSLLQQCVQLQRLSLQNGRRLTAACFPQPPPEKHNGSSSSSSSLATLQLLHVGGCFNMTIPALLHVIQTQCPSLRQLHASGLGWTDAHVQQLLLLEQQQQPQKRTWTHLSLGFSHNNNSTAATSPLLTASTLRQSVCRVTGATLISLALPFCEALVDNALLGMLGRNLPKLRFADVRGNPSLTTLTGWYDGRASADLPAQALAVLGRYSGLTVQSVEETQRIHPVESVELTVILDGGGTGLAIEEMDDDEEEKGRDSSTEK